MDERFNTEPGEESLPFEKKRSRRVSFAENTSVHFFDRDDEYETPADARRPSYGPNFGDSGDVDSAAPDSNDSKEFFHSEDEDNEDELGSRSPFLRLVGSPSPGSTIGSATSNDEENFFGPVSASFIRRRLSDSMASDENHDLTMDSTAFSMHFRSIARSDSEAELKTSTRVHLSFEEKTPIQDSTHTNVGSSMALTQAKQLNSQSSPPISKLSHSSDSNDMSLVEDYIHRYDYDKLSPALNVLLAEGSKDLHVISSSSYSNVRESPRNTGKKLSPSKENGDDLTHLSCIRNEEVENIIHGKLSEDVTVEHNDLDEANGICNIHPISQPAFNFPPDASNAHASNASSPNHLNRGTQSPKSKEAVNVAVEAGSGLDFSAANGGSTPQRNLKTMFQQTTEGRGQEHESPLAVSISTVSAKIRRERLDNFSPSKCLPMTPEKETSSLIRTENKAYVESASSIQGSISKLTRIEASPFSASMSAKINDANIKSLVNFSGRVALDRLEKNSTVPKINHVNYNWIETHCHDASYEKQSLTSAREKGKEGHSINMDVSRIDTSRNIMDVPLKEESGKFLSPLALSAFTSSGAKTYPLGSINTTVGTAAISRNDSMEADIRLGFDNSREEIGVPHTYVSSTEKGLKLIRAPEYHDSILLGQRQHLHNTERATFSPVHAAGSRENVDATLSTAATKSDSLFSEKQGKIFNIGTTTKVEMVENREVALHEAGKELGGMGNFATFLQDKQPEIFRSKITDSDFPSGGLKSVSRDSANKLSFQKNLIDQFCQSPVRKELNNMSDDDVVRSRLMEDVSPKFNQFMSRHLASADRKRRNQDLIFEKDERVERSPKLLKGGISDSQNLECLGSSTISRSGHSLEHLFEITKISGNTKPMLSASADKLNFHAINCLEDYVAQLQRSNKNRIICTDIQSQQTSLDPASNHLHKRVAETRLLLSRIVHDRAKLQLMNMKREWLLKRVQILDYGIKESEVLKLNCLPQQSIIGQVEKANSDKVTATVSALEELERKILSLSKSFHTVCNIKGDPSPVDTIRFVKDHLMKRACCQVIRKHLQLLVVDNLENKNGHQNVVVNYLDLVMQRLMITIHPSPNISISNKSNDIDITNNFKGVDACTAFRFVFNGETTKKYEDIKSLAQETQVSSSLLGNLLDVVEEIQLAWMELQNLMNISFHSHLVEHLDLQLYFADFKCGRKATLTLDLSCLRRGVYPSDILPYQIDISADGPQNHSAESLAAEIRASAQDVSIGYLRILRLCRCFSQFFKLSAG